MQPDWDTIHTELKRPFPEKEIHWRAGATTRDKTKAQALPYAEPRVYEDRLNEVVGHDWECRFTSWDDLKIICELTIMGKTRSSTGQAETPKSDKSPEIQATTAEAQAFKRACAKFGLGRYLYDFPTPWVPYDQQKRQLVETPKHPKLAQPKPNTNNQRLSIEQSNKYLRSLMALYGDDFSPSEAINDISNIVGRQIESYTGLTQKEAKTAYDFLVKMQKMISHRKKSEPPQHSTVETKPQNANTNLQHVNAKEVKSADSILQQSGNGRSESGSYTDAVLTPQQGVELGKKLSNFGLTKEQKLDLASAVFARDINGLMQLKDFEVPILLETAEQMKNGEVRIEGGTLVLVD